MNMKALKCPNCGAALEVESELDMFYCQYCGYKIIMDGQSDAAYQAKVHIKELEHEEKILKQKQDYEKDMNNKIMRCFFYFFIFFVLIFTIYFGSEKISSNREEKKLEKIVQEAQFDAKNKNFDDAYIKAKSIKYTSGWSDDIEKKWDSRRDALLEYISKMEEKETGKTTYEPEKKGFLEKLFN